MAKAPAEKSAPKKGGGKMNLILLVVVALLAVGGGVATPMLLGGHGKEDKEKAEEKEAKKNPKQALVPFGDAVVNLSTESLTRYLRVKLILVVDEKEEKNMNDLLTKKKAFLKNWLIQHLSNQTLQEVTGTAGVHRLSREINDKFNMILFPDGSRKIQDVLFEEFVVQ